MVAGLVKALSLALWVGVIAVILQAVIRALWMVLRDGLAGTKRARSTVATGIVHGLGLTTAIALLATSQLRTWNAIGLFTAAAALRTFVKQTERYIASNT